MKRALFFFVSLFLLFPFGYVKATDYYFSSQNGNDANDGLNSGAPKQSESALYSVLISLEEGDQVYLECESVWYDIDITLTALGGSADSPITISSYGNGNKPKLVSMKKLEGFTDEDNNIWSIIDTDLSDRYYNAYKNINGDTYTYYNDLNFLVVDERPYAMAREPNGNQYLSFEEVATDRSSWAKDNQATWNDDYWNGAHMKVGVTDWISDDVRITGFENGTYYFNRDDWSVLNNKLNNHNGAYRWIKYLLANHRSAMDLEGEWSYEHDNKKLEVYWPADINSSNVYMAYADQCLFLNNCSNINISDIEFQGGIMYTVKLASCVGVNMTNCTFRNLPRMGLFIDYSHNITIGSSLFEDCTGIGIYNSFSRNTIIENNTLNRIGCWASMGGDRDGNNKIAIKDDRRRGTTTIRRNVIDSTGYSGINVTGNSYSKPPSPADLYIQDNDISNFCLIQSDGGGIYIFSDELSPSNTIKQFSGNIIDRGHANVAYMASDGVITNGIYLDGSCDGIEVLDNSIYNTPMGLYTHGTMNSTFRGNNVYNVGNASSRRSGFIGNCAGYGHGGVTDSNAEFKKNQIVLFDTLSSCGTWFYSNFNAAGSVSDSNYYYQPFSKDSLVMTKVVSWSPTQISLDEWRTVTGFDAHSSLNKNGELYNNDLGISEDQFVKFLVNRNHEASREVDLHDCIFEDIDGNVVSGSVSLPARSSMFLFYKSGNVDSLNLIIPDLFYESLNATGTFTLAVSTIGNGTVSPFSGLYDYGEVVVLSASADSGWEFIGWSGDVAGSNGEISITVTFNTNVKATFKKIEADPADTVAKINFAYNSDWDVPGWTNVYGVSSFPVTLDNGINITASGNLVPGESGEPFSSIVPDKVSNTLCMIIPFDKVPGAFTISGLESGGLYNLYLYSSRDNQTFQEAGLTAFSIVGTNMSKSINSVGNNDTFVEFEKIDPSTLTTGAIMLRMTKYDDNYAHINALVITKEMSSGVKKVQNEQIQCYPVPATDYLYFNNLPEAGEIAITNIIGENILVKSYNSSNYKFQIDHLISGIYLVSVLDKNHQLLQNIKVVKR